MDFHAERPRRADGGFSLVEVTIAIMVLAIGVLGLAGTTAITVRQVTASELATKRSVALMSAVERLRSLPYESLGSGSQSIGLFKVAWTTTSGDRSKLVRLVTTGPGLRTGVAGKFPLMTSEVADTFEYRILERW